MLENNLYDYGKKYEKFFFMDIDGTILDERYNLNDNNFILLMNEISESVGLILNSDTPIKPLISFQKQFNIPLNNIVIGEYGSIIGGNNMKDINLLGCNVGKDISFLKKTLYKKLDNIGEIYLLDAQKVIQTEENIGKNNENMFLINKFRKNSFSFYIRKNIKGKLELNNDLFIKTNDIVLSILEEYNDFYIDANNDYGLITIHYKGVHKRNSFNYLEDFLLGEKIMIGNSINDFVDKDDIKQYAVGNSDIDYKEVSCFVSDLDYTKGVIDIINKII